MGSSRSPDHNDLITLNSREGFFNFWAQAIPQPVLYIANVFQLAFKLCFWKKAIVHRSDYKPQREKVVEEGSRVVSSIPSSPPTPVYEEHDRRVGKIGLSWQININRYSNLSNRLVNACFRDREGWRMRRDGEGFHR